jgi:pyruvate-formate lyase-activating enzyme
MKNKCELVKQEFKPGKCLVKDKDKKGPACEITFKIQKGVPYRLISACHLSRPEHYLSIYQSGCNMDCLKCHSWSFSQHAEGKWYSPDDIAAEAEEYSRLITCREPRERATSWHGQELCKGCGSCVQLAVDGEGKNLTLIPTGKKGPLCPNKLEPHQMVLGPQGIGPVRNIVGFTGGDIACKPDFYIACTEKIKEKTPNLHVLLETNGYGLTPKNLDLLKTAGVDSFWLDIKAFDPDVHKKLTGVSNKRILELPGEMIKRGFVLEVLTLFIPGWVEVEQIRDIAEITAGVDKNIPFTILAFFPEYKLRNVPSPNLEQMMNAYSAVKAAGLEHVKLGNFGVFIKNDLEMRKIIHLL